jgi:phage terminase large subunit GpA-like protein
LGETWEEETGAKLGADSLSERAEFYPAGEVPKGAVILTAGVDVQDNRVAVGLYAWGAGEECWLISHTEIYGDPAGQKLWEQVDDLLLRDYPHAEGGRLKVSQLVLTLVATTPPRCIRMPGSEKEKECLL